VRRLKQCQQEDLFQHQGLSPSNRVFSNRSVSQQQWTCIAKAVKCYAQWPLFGSIASLTSKCVAGHAHASPVDSQLCLLALSFVLSTSTLPKSSTTSAYWQSAEPLSIPTLPVGSAGRRPTLGCLLGAGLAGQGVDIRRGLVGVAARGVV